MAQNKIVALIIGSIIVSQSNCIMMQNQSLAGGVWNKMTLFVVEGSDLSLKCPNAGLVQSLVWFLNSSLVKYSENLVMEKDTLTITDVKWMDRGVYRCTVTYIDQVMVNTTYQVEIKKSDESEQTRIANAVRQTLRSCQAPEKDVQVYRKKFSDRKFLKKKPNRAFICNVRENDIQLAIFDRKYIDQFSSSNRKIKVSDYTTINVSSTTCVADSVCSIHCPKDSIWLRNGYPFENWNPYSHIVYNLNEEQIMDIEHVVKKDEGLYTCVYNASGSIEMKFVEIKVTGTTSDDHPSFIARNFNKQSQIGGNVTISCALKSRGFTTVKLFRISNSDPVEKQINLIKLENSAKFREVKQRELSYTIVNVSEADAGKYTCWASNNIGRSSITFAISIKTGEPFSMPMKLDDNTGGLKWNLINIGAIALVAICICVFATVFIVKRKHRPNRLLIHSEKIYSVSRGEKSEYKIDFDSSNGNTKLNGH